MADSSCIFCKIVAREIAAKEVARDERAVAFHDVAAQAPAHLLVVPTAHVADLSEYARRHDSADLGHLLATASRLGQQFGPGGYRLVINEGRDAGQSVFHLHVHVLAGRPLAWPPG